MTKKKVWSAGAVITAVLLFFAAGLLVLNFSYRLHKGSVVAVIFDTGQILKPEQDREEAKQAVRLASRRFSENEVNTVFMSLNRDGASSYVDLEGLDSGSYKNYFGNDDIFPYLEKELSKERIQLYGLIDCREIAADRIRTVVRSFAKNYKPVGIVLTGLDSEKLQEVESQGRNVDMIVMSSSRDLIKSADETGIFSAYVYDGGDIEQCIELRGDLSSQKPVYPDYTGGSISADVFLMSNFYGFDGAVISQYAGQDDNLSLVSMFMERKKDLPKFGFTVSKDFAVTYPEQDIDTYYDGIFITGTGRTDGKVYVNGQSYNSRRDGTFGVYAELTEGLNPFTVERQGEKSSFTVNRLTSSGGGGDMKFDDTEDLPAGSMVVTGEGLTSVLSDPDSDGSIIAGFDRDTVLKITGSIVTQRSGKKTYAYSLSNGGYVLASDVTIMNSVSSNGKIGRNKSLPSPVISSARLENGKDGDVTISFTISGYTTGIIPEFNPSENTLSLLFLDSVLPESGKLKISDTAYFTSYEISQKEEGLYITFALNPENIPWGFDIKTAAGKADLTFRHRPVLPEGSKPLEGIKVVLDPGHGGQDNGAAGIAGGNGPVEKELNLALAQATKYLLEEYGARVYMTRDDDTFYTLEERRNMLREVKPDIFIAMHHNSMDYSYNSTDVTGCQCYYFTKQSRDFAELLCKDVSEATDRRDRGAKQDYYYVTRADVAPAVLMEYGYLINPSEYSRVYTDEDIYKAAVGTVRAITEFLMGRQ